MCGRGSTQESKTFLLINQGDPPARIAASQEKAPPAAPAPVKEEVMGAKIMQMQVAFLQAAAKAQ